MNATRLLLPFLLGATVFAQTTTVFPDEYAAVPEGPTYSPNMPLAYGTSRVQCVYEAVDLAIPSGHQISQIGWRQDGVYTSLDPGYMLQLEIRMGYSQETAASLGSNFANNWSSTPVTVFGPGIYTLPDLRDPANPLPNGQFFITLATPFTYDPSQGNLMIEYLISGNSNGGQSWNYRLDRGDFYSPVTYGPVGCPGSNGTPDLQAQPTRPGYSYSTTCYHAPANSFGVLAIVPGGQLVPPYSLQPYIHSIQASCTGQVDLLAVLTMTGISNSSGNKTWSFTIPNNAAFNDFDWASQAVFFDFFVPGGAVVSNGAHVLTGVRPRTSILRASGPPAFATTGSLLRNYNPVIFFVHQ